MTTLYPRRRIEKLGVAPLTSMFLYGENSSGKRFDDFLKERMKGRSPVNVKLDQEGKGSALLSPGSWWLHAKLKGDEEIEWRLPVTVIGAKQVVELTAQNAYTRSRVF